MQRASEQGPSERKLRAMEIAEREAALVRQQSDFDCARTIAWRDQGVKVVAGEAELEVRAELRALRAERKKLLEQVKRREAELRPKQNKFNRARSSSGGRKQPVSEAERAVRAELAMLASERAHLDGTAARDRAMSAVENAMWNTITSDFTSADW